MQQFLLMAHSGWRWLVFVAAVLSLGYGLWGWLTNQRWQPTARKILLFATIAVDIQWLLGIVLYIARSGWQAQYGTAARFEHPFIMTLAFVAMHVANARAKRATADRSRYQIMALGTLVAVVLVVVGIMRLAGGSSRLFGMG